MGSGVDKMAKEMKELRQFREKMGKKVEGLDLIITYPDDWEEEGECEIMERRDNGKVWMVKYGLDNIIDIIELQRGDDTNENTSKKFGWIWDRDIMDYMFNRNICTAKFNY